MDETGAPFGVRIFAMAAAVAAAMAATANRMAWKGRAAEDDLMGELTPAERVRLSQPQHHIEQAEQMAERMSDATGRAELEKSMLQIVGV